jgi:hypothetical protein
MRSDALLMRLHVLRALAAVTTSLTLLALLASGA